MTEETQGQGFGQEPDVPSDATADEAARVPGSADQAEPGAGGAQAREAAEAQLADARRQLAERTGDLQRLQAEYANYRKRVERDRIAVKEAAIANALTELLPVIDDIGRAREHGELVGGFKSVAESLETVAAKMGLQQFGKEGEAFDPLVHEALMHSYSPDVTETTCVQILQPGYRIGDRTIRPARVAVAEPQPGVQHSSSDEAEGSEEENGGPEQG
ncbi:nucleotide exchange factor GrpE [Wenjunlia tyrosinilytica]|uniref:Protein GrpE n=1 Tax=Wenjunlia tyrosinilytica TaxID=1544741 RepID=A0A917ZMH3_9ACTN|nr:nucleotide exchange factor GrpE [Wenjunlia tyrosinilytica]GGO84943.1 protein GrpE [Wenjunlia tyrosinilytica]